MSMTMMTRLLLLPMTTKTRMETDTPVDTPTYFVDASYSDREVPANLFDLNQFVNDDDSADNADLTFTVSDAPPHGCVQPEQ